jgi:hypothetical protein
VVASSQRAQDGESASVAIRLSPATSVGGEKKMSMRIANLDPEAEYVLTRAEWAEARAAYLRASGNQRDDAALPYPVPPGAVWARKVTGVEAVDQARVGSSQVRYRLLYGDPASDRASAADTVEARPASDLVTTTATIAPNLQTTLAPDPRAWVGKWVADGGTGASAPMPAADWWYATPWGKALAVAFVPPHAAPAGYPQDFRFPADTVPFSEDGSVVDVVLVRKAHPFIPAAALERQRGGPDVVVDGVTRVPVSSRGFAWNRGDGQVPSRTGVGTGAAARAPGWMGLLYREASSGIIPSFIDSVESAARQVRDVAQQAGKNLVRAAQGDLGALQSLAAAALATAVLGPTGAALAGSTDPWRDAARLGAVHYALFLSPLVRAARGGMIVESLAGSSSAADGLVGQPVRPGATPINAPTYHVAGLDVTLDDVAAAEVWAQRLSVANPSELNRILQQITLAGGYVDLVLARLTIEAETRADQREALKAMVAAKQAEFNERYLKYITAALAVIPGIGTALTVASLLYQAGVALQGIEVQLRAARQAELALDREIRAMEMEIAALEREAADAASGPAPAASGADAVSSGPVAKGWETFWSFLIRAWRGAA